MINPVVAEKGCWEQFQETVKTGWNFVWDKTGLATQAITHIFFRTVGIFSPRAADQLEIYWGHFTTMWVRYWGNIREEELIEQITQLQEQNQILSQLAHARNQEAIALRNASAAFDDQREILSRRQEELSTQLRAQIYNNGELNIRVDHLRRENSFLGEERDQFQQRAEQNGAAHAEVVGERDQLKNDLAHAQQSNHRLARELAEAQDHSKLALSLAQLKEVITGRLSGNEAESALTELLESLEKTRKLSHQQLEQCLEDLPAESPQAIPTRSIIRISEKTAAIIADIIDKLRRYSAEQKDLSQVFGQAIQTFVQLLTRGK